MRVLNRRSILTAGLAASLSAPAWACRELGIFVDGEAQFLDRSWVQSNTALYGVDYYRGAFRLRLDGEGIEVLGGRNGLLDAELSRDKRWLKCGVWLYDTRDGREMALTDLFGGTRQTIRFSPKGDLLAAPSAADRVLRVFVPDTREMRIHSLEEIFSDDPMPRHELEQQFQTHLHPVIWSTDGGRILFSRYFLGKSRTQQHWSVEVSTGKVSAIDADTIDSPWPPPEVSAYRDKGIIIGAPCERCHLPQAVDDLNLEDGGRARLILSRGLVVTDQHGREAVIDTSLRMPIRPPAEHYTMECGGPDFVLLGAIDGRYLIYNRDGVYWLYGVREGRKALLSSSRNGVKLVW